MFHQGDHLITYADYTAWEPATPHPFHLSRFVASYAVNSTDQFAEWMEHFSAFHVIDVVNLAPEDFDTANNGLRQIFSHISILTLHCESSDGLHHQYP